MLAHQGGWDEMLLVVGPMIVIVALLRLAKRRVERLDHAAPGTPPSTSSDGSPPEP
jgi:hypothetical protein